MKAQSLLPSLLILYSTPFLVNGAVADQTPLHLGPNYTGEVFDLDTDLPFSQPVTFAHLPWQRCLSSTHHLTSPLDIAILGFPYDTSTSYRPGARFGPRGIRAASSREKKGRSFNSVWEVDPFEGINGEDNSGLAGMTMIDCGDVPVTPFDAKAAMEMMEQGYGQVLCHRTSTNFEDL